MSFIKKLIKGSDHKNNKNKNPEISQKQQKLSKKLALAESDPEPILDLTSTGLDRLDLPAIISLVKVHSKRKLYFSSNSISAFEPIRTLCTAFQNISVIHLEENQIQHFRLSNSQSLPVLKELYLSSNLLSSFEITNFQSSLPILKVLSLRNNNLKTFPLTILKSESINFVDISYNQITEIPKDIVSSNISKNLETLVVLEGNKIESIPLKELSLLDDADSYPLLRQTLAGIYGINIEEFDDFSYSLDDLKSSNPGITDHSRKTCNGTNMNNCYNNDGDDEEHCSNDELHHRIGAYELQKNRARKLALEFEINSIKTTNNSNPEVVSKSSRTSDRIEDDLVVNSQNSSKTTPNGTNVTSYSENISTECARGKLLVALAQNDEQLSERIHHFQAKKDVAKRALLDDYIRRLQEEFQQKLSQINDQTTSSPNDFQKTSQDDEDATEDLALKDALDAYANGLKSKHDSMLEHLVLSDKEGFEALQFNSNIKQAKSGAVIAELSKQDAELSETFNRWQNIRSARNSSYLQRISVIEEQLLTLSFLELTRKNDANEVMLSNLASQRSQLASMLKNLLEEKHARDKALMLSLEQQFEQRFHHDSDTNSSWLEQFQTFLGNEPFEVQLEHYDLDQRMFDYLCFVHKNLDDCLVNSFLYYLPHFVDLKFFDSNFQTNELLKIGIRDVELCSKLAELFLQHSEQLNHDLEPSAPSFGFELTSVELSEPSSKLLPSSGPITSIFDASQDPNSRATTNAFRTESTRIWCESECVICLDSLASILFLPCGHVCTCRRCVRRAALNLDQCPLCRINIDLMQPVHRTTNLSC